MTDDRGEIDGEEGGSVGKARERIAPRLGLKGQIKFITELRRRALMSDGEPADEAWLLLRPIDLERLDDLANALDILAIKTEEQTRKAAHRSRQ